MKSLNLYLGAVVLGTSLFGAQAQAASPAKVSDTGFNPAVSLILDGRYTDIKSGEQHLHGFQEGGEMGLPSQGFSTGHNELAISSNIDDKFYGAMTSALVQHGGETKLELEEAFIETLQLGAGFTVKGGRFLSGVGYLNEVHAHAHDFADTPLVYDALMGGHLADTGVQVRWVAPTPFYMSFGAESTTGTQFPGGANEKNNAGAAGFIEFGGDLGDSSSWQLGLNHYQTEFDVREAGGHDHGGHGHGEEESVDNELADGEISINGIDLVYKWAPNGNSKNINFKFQTEYFVRNEKGEAEFAEGEEGTPTYKKGEAEYKGKQSGYYAQAVYQFMPAWRVGLRYDSIEADNELADFASVGTAALTEEEFAEESGLGSEENPVTRQTIMFDYAPSHFSMIRLQLSETDYGHEYDKNPMAMVQYVMSLGAHGAHSF